MRKITIFIIAALVLIISAVFYFVYPMLFVATGYAARRMCSCHFVEGRAVKDILANDLGRGPQGYTTTVVDETNRSATSTMFGLARQYAEFREHLGCVLVQGKDDSHVELQLPVQDSDVFDPFQIENDSSVQFDREMLSAAIERGFDASLETDSAGTRAVVVVYKGVIAGEMYAHGFGAETPLLGWSMTKSITNAMAGILVKEGKLSLQDTALFEYWTDERKNISLKDLLQMQSGLKFNEDYSTLSDATDMLFKSGDMVARAAHMPLQHEPGTFWSYSSGTTNILSGIIRSRFRTLDDYLKFPHQRIFQPLGMKSALIEVDESGNFVGSSYGFATPRDWAKFGLLYLNQGHWFGTQLLDSSWVAFTRQPASQSKGVYGAQFWLNHGYSTFPDVPPDMFYCSGFEGQYVFIIPSRDLVIVRMGLDSGDNFDVNIFLRDIIAAFPLDSDQ